MAARRPLDDSDENLDRSGGKRIKRPPSFSTVIKEARVVDKFQHIIYALEPFLRKVVQEEVERTVLIHTASLVPQRSLQMQIEAAEPPSLKLIFKKPPSQPFFTGAKIEDHENNPLQILILDSNNNVATACSSMLKLPPLKVELVALEGDFASGDQEDWTSDEFQSKIAKERTGKRPLLVGGDGITLRDGVANIPNLCFTDNSSWVKSGMFKIGARIVPGSYDGPRIKEAMTEAFKVKDHRGEAYKKHHPPSLGDDVWRLEKIGKDGKFHKRLEAKNINTVQDFLKLLFVDPHCLRRILGPGMSDRMWEVTTDHAKTCVAVDDKLYLHRGTQCHLILNQVCKVVSILAGINTYTPQDLINRADRDCVHQLAREAYENWDNLEEYHGMLSNGIIPLDQSVQMPQAAIGSLPLFIDQDQFGECSYDPSQTF